MNDAPLSLDHGYPLRVIVPGTVGARSVKWLSTIRLSPIESQGHWQQNDYKFLPPCTEWGSAVDYSCVPAIQDMPVQSAILSPLDLSTLPPDSESIQVEGYAWSGGGRKVIRLDVSIDDGRTWHPASFQHEDVEKEILPDDPYANHWAWRIWKAEIQLPEAVLEAARAGQETTLEVCCKATDSSCNSQPSDTLSIWNIRGLVNNSWHRIRVVVPSGSS